MVSLAERRRGAEYLEGVHAVSERRACQVVEIARSTKRRPSGCIKKVALLAEIHVLSEQYPRFGYRKIYARLKGSRWRVGREQVRLLRRREGLGVPQKAPKRRRRFGRLCGTRSPSRRRSNRIRSRPTDHPSVFKRSKILR